MVAVVLARRKTRTKSATVSYCYSHPVISQCLYFWCHRLVLFLAIMSSSSSSSSIMVSGSAVQENVHVNDKFYMQRLGVPFAGQHTGVAVFDLNGDGHDDLLFSSGRHWVDQSYIMMNLGIDPDMPWQYKFSKENAIGKPGGYNQVDASTLSSMRDDSSTSSSTSNNETMITHHTAVLLAGSVCTVEIDNEFGSCELGSTDPAVLLHVTVQGCSVHDEPQDEKSCRVSWKEVWREPNPKGNRNGAFAATLGDGTDPAIVLVGTGGISIFEPKGYYGYDDDEPTFVILPDDQLPDNPEDDITRSAGLAVGYLGDYWPGIIVGPRTLQSVYPAPLIAVYKEKHTNNHSSSNSEYDWYDFGDARYQGDTSKAPQPSGLALADLNGDGYFDIVEANYLDPFDIQAGYGLDQNYYLLDHNGYATHSSRIFTAPNGGRSVHAGDIYNDSEFPDLAFGDSDGNVILFANLGNHPNTGVFRGFEQRDVFQVSENAPGCEVRGIKIASLSPCSVSILTAVTCLNGQVLDEGQNSNRAIHRIDPTGQSCLPPPPSSLSSSSSSQTTPPPLSYPVEPPPSPLGGEGTSAAASLGQASSAPRLVPPVITLRYQYGLIGGWAGALLFLCH